MVKAIKLAAQLLDEVAKRDPAFFDYGDNDHEDIHETEQDRLYGKAAA